MTWANLLSEVGRAGSWAGLKERAGPCCLYLLLTQLVTTQTGIMVKLTFKEQFSFMFSWSMMRVDEVGVETLGRQVFSLQGRCKESVWQLGVWGQSRPLRP